MAVMRDKNIWRRMTLIGLILLSFVLSVLLFSTGGHLGEGVTDLTNIATNQPSPSVVERHLTLDVYRPAQIVLHTPNDNNAKHIIKDQQLSDDILHLFNNVQLSEVSERSELSAEQYQSLLLAGEWTELVFSDQLPFGVYNHLFANLPSDYAEQTFDRIIVQTSSPTDLYFYNYKRQLLYRVPIDKRPTDPLPSIAELDGRSYLGYGLQLSGNLVYLPFEDLEIERKRYMIDQLSNTLYINQFFKDTSSVESRTSGDETRYIDLTKEVTINDATHLLTFLSQQTSTDEIALTQRLSSSFDTLNRFENWQDDVIYQSYNPENYYVTYQRYIDGLPVFDSGHLESTIEIATVETGLTHLKLPLRFIRTPISINEDNMRSLPSGPDVVDTLQQAGLSLSEDVQDIEIGLTWNESSENENVIFFEPQWYVKVRNEWQTLNQAVQSDNEMLSADTPTEGGDDLGL